MGIISRFTKFDKCCYWAPASEESIDRYGEGGFLEAVELDCRWEDVVELIQLPNGEQFASKSTVYVDIDLALGGILWHGLLVAKPLDPPLANKIQHKMSIPNLRNKETLRGVYL